MHDLIMITLIMYATLATTGEISAITIMSLTLYEAKDQELLSEYQRDTIKSMLWTMLVISVFPVWLPYSIGRQAIRRCPELRQ